MAHFNFTVPTEPMAESIDGVNKNVKVVGTAVTAMQAAVIAAEQKAADTVCKSINQGFFMLMRSRISQRVSQFASTMNSRASSMMETASSIDHTHLQMRGDFNRIKSRYAKVFERLDRSLEERVRELDRDAMALAQARESVIYGRQLQEAPSTLCYSGDLSTVALKSTSARLKSNARDSIDELGESTGNILDCSRSISDAIEDQPQEGFPFVCIPAVYSVEESYASPGSFTFDVQVPKVLPQEVRASVERGLRERSEALGEPSQQDMVQVRLAFERRLAASGIDDRTAQTMMRLFDASFPAGVGMDGMPQMQPQGGAR